MDSANKNNIPTYKANSRGNKRGGRGGSNNSNYKSDQKVETIRTPNKPNSPPQREQKDSEANLKKEITITRKVTSTSNTNISSVPSQITSSPQVKNPSKSKKANIDFQNLPGLDSSNQKNLDVSVNESKGEINQDASLISEDNRSLFNENDKSVENSDNSNKNVAIDNIRKQSANVHEIFLKILDENINNNSEKINDDVSIHDEISLNTTNNENLNESDLVSAEAIIDDQSRSHKEIQNKKETLDTKIHEVNLDAKFSVKNMKENFEDKCKMKFITYL